MSEALEIAYTLGRLQAEIEDLAVGGLRAAGPERLQVLDAMRAEFDQVGATHLVARLDGLRAAIRDGDRGAAAELMRTQASLRVFERLLTLEFAAARMRALVEAARPESGDE